MNEPSRIAHSGLTAGAVAIVAAALLAAGCNRAVNTMVGGRPSLLAGQMPMVIVGNPGLQEKIELVEHARRGAGDVMEVTVVLQSHVTKPLQFEYKFTWYDSDGFEVADSTAHWTPEIIQGMESRKRVGGVAPGPRAKTFKIMIREPQPLTR